jgi:hypothetical protein
MVTNITVNIAGVPVVSGKRLAFNAFEPVTIKIHHIEGSTSTTRMIEISVIEVAITGGTNSVEFGAYIIPVISDEYFEKMIIYV